MKSRTIFSSLVLVALGWTVPSHAAPQPNRYTVPEKKLPSPEVKWRVVGLRQKATDPCPQVPGWQGGDWLQQTLRKPQDPYRYSYRQSHQPGQPERDRRRAVAAMPLLGQLGLDRFCAYTANAGSPPSPFPKSLQGLSSVANSQMALAPTGEPDPDSAKILGQHFLDQTSRMPDAAETVLVASHRPPVRLVFLDTQPSGEGVPHTSGPSKHGYTLVHLARQLACPDVVGSDPCPIELATRLALPYNAFDPDVPPAETLASSAGGNLGLVDELATAIVQEVLDWWPDSGRKHLILNLSVGWNGELLDELGTRKVSQLRADTRLVYNALQLARRSGALVIAAAGNRRGGGESKWPLLPAAWELRRPSCWPLTLGPKPVYAVGGVDWQGLPLPNYRFGGLPRRVAFGDHAVARTESPDDPTAMYTGSSVSTAVVSAIAAVVWQLRPELGAADVMRLLGRSGDVLPGRADYYAWKDLWPFSKLIRAPHMRRLTLCQAVVRARKQGGERPVPNCQRPKKEAADLSALLSSVPSTLPALTAAALPSLCSPASDPTPRLFAVPAHGVPDPCPLYLWPDMVSQRWVAPQPDEAPCPGCSFVPPHSVTGALALEEVPDQPPGYVLMIEIDPKWQPPAARIESAALDVDRYSKGRFIERKTYDIPVADLEQAGFAGGSHRLHLKEVDSLTGCTVTLNFKVTVAGATYSVQSPVYVDP